MRCFEVTEMVTEGLPLICSTISRPHVLVTGKGGVLNEHSGQIMIAETLAEKIEQARAGGTFGVTRLMRCDYEQRSAIWLVPEDPSAQNAKAALILFSAHHLQARTPGKLRFESSGVVESESVILQQNSFTTTLEHYPADTQGELIVRTGLAILAKLLPGTSISAIETVTEVVNTGWRKSEEVSKDIRLSTVGMRLDGTVYVKFHSNRERYIMRIASGPLAQRFVSGD